jgi:hypothetical protein
MYEVEATLDSKVGVDDPAGMDGDASVGGAESTSMVDGERLSIATSVLFGEILCAI